ncbi:hypothetical protein DYBT9275_04692 [Dyadobacter sp. CECT 9275]|uniref:Tetratricopeptide repeat protein n=1 Tax=Dyadobacter helix TaxID=2822344 RepID=A0A916NDE4_9BACT|nr:hypothetical protein [Dyadobacter sp. CECT 9275]CAG5010323.1 hypothetical protein DYBT9275_04692 [Dyadobacter sp. CECT 9275]
MKELFFWKVWSPSERRLAITVLIIILLSLLFLLLKSINPLSNVIQWNVLSELSEVSAVPDGLRLGAWQYGVSVPVQLVSEQFIASVMHTDPLTVDLFLVLALTGLSLVLAALTAVPRFWYLAGIILFILLLTACRLEMLHVFGEGNRTFFIISILLYGGLSYYFHAFRPDYGMAARVWGMLGVSAILTITAALGAQAPMPALAAVTYSFPLWLILATLFLLMVSTEIMAGLVWLSSSESVGKGRGGLMNFIVISVLYLLYLLLFYLKNTRRIDWDLTLLNPVYFMIVGAVTGLWGFRRRADSTEGVLPFRSSGFWLYSGLMIITAAFAGLSMGMANDPLLEVLEDVTVQGQLAMSVLFFFYVLVNFYPLFKQGLAVHKVLYKPLRFGLTQTRLFGFAGVVILFSIQRLFPFYQGMAGYFNGLGDLHTQTRELTLAEQYYKLALQQEFQNHKSNYALASLALQQGDRNAAAFYFRQALLKNPSPQAYAGLSTVLIDENLFFDAIFSLKEGISKFPESGELLNNLGMLYSKTNVADSAYYFLEKAEKETSRTDVPATNLLFVLAKSADSALLDSLSRDNKTFNSISWQANSLAVRNLRQDFSASAFDATSIPHDSLLSASSFAYLVNYAINQARNDSMPATLLPKLSVTNPVLSQDLTLAGLYSGFYSGDKLKALETLQAWAEEEGPRQQLYRKILGHWFLQLGLYDKAIEQLSDVEGIEGTIGMAVANALSGNQAVATVLLDKMLESEKNPAVQLLKETLATGARPRSPLDSLLAAAEKSPSERNYIKAVKANPFDETVVAKTSEWYRQKKQTAKAYQIVVNALRLKEYAPLIWEQYALLSLEQGLLTQASEAEAKVKQLAEPAVYQQFMSRYQPMRALIEKQRAEFQ